VEKGGSWPNSKGVEAAAACTRVPRALPEAGFSAAVCANPEAGKSLDPSRAKPNKGLLARARATLEARASVSARGTPEVGLASLAPTVPRTGTLAPAWVPEPRPEESPAPTPTTD
jgi:hypothetical protein